MSFFWSLAFLAAVPFVMAYPSGAPVGVCVDLIPGHRNMNQMVISPQAGQSPYALCVSKDMYTPGEELTVSITGGSFEGIILQARLSDDTLVGTFSDPPQNTKLLQCTSPEDTVTHTNCNVKSAGTSFTWTAPGTDVGNVTFTATVVQEYDVFWVNLTSQEITTSNSSATQEMACQILANNNIYLLDNNGHLNPEGANDGADAKSNINDTCEGRRAKRSSYCCKEGCAPGGSVSLKASVLEYILDVANSGQYNNYLQINTIAGACHSSNSWHYQGTAVDFQIKSGDSGYASSWMGNCSAAGARENIGPPTSGHKAHTHCAFPSRC